VRERYDLIVRPAWYPLRIVAQWLGGSGEPGRAATRRGFSPEPATGIAVPLAVATSRD